MTTDKSSEREPTTRVKTFDDKTLVVEAATGAVIKNYHPRLTSMAVAFHEGIEYARAALPQQAQEAQTEAYADGRNDEREELTRLLAWAYRKLSPYSFATQDDALAMDEIKLLLEHGQ